MKRDPYIVRDPSTPAKFEARHSICLFAPYFGKIPPSMPLFLKSCAWNSTIQWFIHSDADWSALSVPSNVTIIPCKLAAIAEQTAKILECKVAMPRPYKLCDLRPMYGVVFADLARGFDFWGHCDLDLIFGDLRAFLPAPALDTCKRLYENGHLSVYRNDEQMCNAFRLPAEGVDWRDVLSDPVSRVFDENGMNKIARSHGFPTFRNFLACASIPPQHRDFRSNGEPGSRQPRVWVWRKGKIFREFYEKGEFGREEFAYIHILRRQMELSSPQLVESCDNWLIVPNAFIPTDEKPISAAEMLRLNRGSWRHHLRWQIRRVGERWKRKRSDKRIRSEFGYGNK